MRKVKTGEHGGLPGDGTFPAGAAIRFREGTGRREVWLELRAQGRDWLLLVGGGEAHVGAVGVAWPGGATLMEVPGHKEGPLARLCADRVSAAAEATCTAVVGIHQDDATREEIAEIVNNVKAGLGRIIAAGFALKENGSS